MSVPHHIAHRHIPHFDNWYQPAREAVLAAIREALATTPKPEKPE